MKLVSLFSLELLLELVVLLDVKLLLGLSLQLLQGVNFRLAVLGESLITLLRVILLILFPLFVIFLFLLGHHGTFLDDQGITIFFLSVVAFDI